MTCPSSTSLHLAADGRQMALIDDQNIAVQYIGE